MRVWTSSFLLHFHLYFFCNLKKLIQKVQFVEKKKWKLHNWLKIIFIIFFFSWSTSGKSTITTSTSFVYTFCDFFSFSLRYLFKCLFRVFMNYSYIHLNSFFFGDKLDVLMAFVAFENFEFEFRKICTFYFNKFI